MYLNVESDDLADAGQPPHIMQTVTAADNANAAPHGAKIELRPESEDQEFQATTGITAQRGKNLDSFFAVDQAGGSARKFGKSEPSVTVTEPKDIQAVARNLGIPSTDIAAISYDTNGGKITHMQVEFRQGIDPDTLGRHNNTLVTNFEKQGQLPNGTAFQMGMKGLTDAEFKSVGIATLDNGRLLPLELSGTQNAMGHDLKITPNLQGGSQMVFGHDLSRAGDSGTYRSVSAVEYAAAEKLAAALGGTLVGEVGATMHGVKILLDQEINVVVNKLAAKGIVANDVARDLQDAVDAGDVTVSRREQLSRMKADMANTGLTDAAIAQQNTKPQHQAGGGAPMKRAAHSAPKM